MTTPYDVAEKMAAILSTVQGLPRATPYETSQISAPCAQVAVEEFDPRYVFTQASATYQFEVIVYASTVSDRAADKLLQGFRALSGASSVTAAIQTSANWGSVDIDYAQVTLIGRTRVELVGAEEYWVLRFNVEVVF